MRTVPLPPCGSAPKAQVTAVVPLAEHAGYESPVLKTKPDGICCVATADATVPLPVFLTTIVSGSASPRWICGGRLRVIDRSGPVELEELLLELEVELEDDEELEELEDDEEEEELDELEDELDDDDDEIGTPGHVTSVE